MTDRRAMTLPSGPSGSTLLGFGSTQGNRVVTNEDLAELVDTNDEWIQQRVGIASRRLGDDDQTVVSMGATAGAKAIADAGLMASDVDQVIVATCTLPCPIPNAAGQISDRIGISAPGAFDLNAACAGFCYALNMASDMIRTGSASRVLIIGAERFQEWIDWSDRANCIIFADAAGAAVVGPADEPRIGQAVLGSAGELADMIYLREDKYIYQEGQSVFRWATSAIAPIAQRAVERSGLSLSDVDALVAHQANLRIVESIAKKLQDKGARSDMVIAKDIIHSGNTSAASIPLAIDHLRSAGEITSGGVLLLVGFGAGLSYAGQVVICP